MRKKYFSKPPLGKDDSQCNEYSGNDNGLGEANLFALENFKRLLKIFSQSPDRFLFPWLFWLFSHGLISSRVYGCVYWLEVSVLENS